MINRVRETLVLRSAQPSLPPELDKLTGVNEIAQFHVPVHLKFQYAMRRQRRRTFRFVRILQ